MDIEILKEKFQEGEHRFTKHAIKRMILREISEKEIREAVLNGEIIEEYPSDKYSPSCLIYGKTSRGRHLHIQCSLPPRVKVVTVYEPEEKEWTNYRIRR